MLIRLFNFLVKRTYFGIALAIPGLIWACLAASLGGMIIFSQAQFEVTGTEQIFILTLFIMVLGAVIIGLVKFGFFRLIGKRWEHHSLKVLNENIIQGEIRTDLSDQELLEVYNSLDKANIFMSNLVWKICIGIVLIGGGVEYSFAGQFTNTPLILIGGFIATLIAAIFNINFAFEMLSPIRKKCKQLLFKRKVYFKEIPLTNLKTKFKFLILLISLILVIIFILVYPFDLNLIIVSLVGLVMLTLTVWTIFSSFYQALEEIKQSAKKLEVGERVIFFSGSTDREIIDLSESLNKTAENIRKYQIALEESKTVLEIKVRARTRELQELAKSLEDKVRERTKELQERIDQLERFQRLTIGRELKMRELKKEIKRLQQQLKKYKK